jgi:hypothetical protein
MRNALLPGVTLAVTLVGFGPTAIHADSRILIDAKINERPVRLAFDTGSESSILFRSVADRLELRVVGEPPAESGPTGAVRAVWTEACRLELCGYRQSFRFGVIDAPAYQTWDMDGCIAWKDVRLRVIHLDSERRRCTVSDELPSDLRGWTKWRLMPDSRLLTVECSNNQSVVKIGIDTGCSTGVQLNGRPWSAWQKERTQPATLEARYGPGGGLSVHEVYRAKSIVLGSLVLEDVPVTSMTPSADAGFEHSDAILGLFSFSRLELLLDGKRGTLYTRPIANSSLQYDYNRLGAVFVPLNSGMSDDLIAHVARGSVADLAGIRNGDQLMKIGDLDATKWRSDPAVLPFHRFWSQPAGTKLRLRLSRDGEPYEVEITLKDLPL